MECHDCGFCCSSNFPDPNWVSPLTGLLSCHFGGAKTLQARFCNDYHEPLGRTSPKPFNGFKTSWGWSKIWELGGCSQFVFVHMGVSKNSEKLQIIHLFIGIPLFSPSILGVFPLFFGSTPISSWWQLNYFLFETTDPQGFMIQFDYINVFQMGW